MIKIINYRSIKYQDIFDFQLQETNKYCASSKSSVPFTIHEDDSSDNSRKVKELLLPGKKAEIHFQQIIQAENEIREAKVNIKF